MKYKVGEKVRVKKDLDQKNDYQIFPSEPMYVYRGEIVTITGINGVTHRIKEDNGYWSWSEDMFEKIQEAPLAGIELLTEIKEGRIKNCEIKVFKNKEYMFTISCGEKGILDNSNFHVGMLTSDKYTYEPIVKREMTISQIEKELGYSIKIIEE